MGLRETVSGAKSQQREVSCIGLCRLFLRSIYLVSKRNRIVAPLRDSPQTRCCPPTDTWWRRKSGEIFPFGQRKVFPRPASPLQAPLATLGSAHLLFTWDLPLNSVRSRSFASLMDSIGFFPQETGRLMKKMALQTNAVLLVPQRPLSPGSQMSRNAETVA